MCKLNVTGDEGEASTHNDLEDVQHAVARHVRDWLFDEYRGSFGWGEQELPGCERHAPHIDGACEDCHQAAEEALTSRIDEYVSGRIDAWIGKLERDGTLSVGPPASGQPDHLTFHLAQEAP